MIYEQPLKKEEKVLPEPTTGKQHIQSSQKIGLPKQQSPPSQAHSPVFIESSQIPSCINSLSGQSKNIFQKRDCRVQRTLFQCQVRGCEGAKCQVWLAFQPKLTCGPVWSFIVKYVTDTRPAPFSITFNLTLGGVNQRIK